MLIEGKLANNNSAARLTLSNKTNPNAYGSLTWHGQNGEGWFAFNKDLDMNSEGLHSVGRIRLTGEKVICEGNLNRILLDNKVVITKVSGNGAGFTVKGKTNAGNNADLLYVYHNSTGLDAINYAGKQDSAANLATVGYVDNAVSTNQESVQGSLLSHTERLLHTSNGTNGKQFYFWNENNAPTDGMNSFRRFKWKLPSSHYLSGMVGAGNNMGFLVIQGISGNLLYQCQISRAEKTSNSLYIDLHLDHETHYGSSQLAYGSYFIVSLYSCLREG